MNFKRVGVRYMGWLGERKGKVKWCDYTRISIFFYYFVNELESEKVLAWLTLRQWSSRCCNLESNVSFIV